MAELNEKTVEAIRALALRSGTPLTVPGGNIPLAVIPSDCKVEDLSRFIFNEHQAAPSRKKGTVAVLDPESFIQYWTLFSDPNSRAFAYEPEITVTGVLDYHGAGTDGGPRWGQHRVILTLQQSEEWKAWIGANNRQMTQEAFGEFLEQHSIDISSPSPAHMVEVAKDLQAKTEVEFGSAQRAQDGQVKFQYTEETKATVGKGQLAVPEQFVVSIPAFIGGQRTNMQALFRFRIKEGDLTLWYTLIRPDAVRRTAFMMARNQIADSLKVEVINGKA